MAFTIFSRLTSYFWTSASAFLLGIWRRIVYGPLSRDVEQAVNKWPVAPKAKRAATTAFLASLQPSAIEALASRYNGGKACRVIGKENGSFNVCFFVEFLDCKTRWAVRIPIEAAVHDPWTKLQSEVATLNHLRRHTTVPVPTVYGYGKGEVLTDDNRTTQVFLICEMMLGHPLVLKHFNDADDDTRAQFFLQLFDYLHQIRSLEFPKIGSLMPTDSDEAVVDGFSSFATNDLGLRLPAFTSAKAYMQSQFDLLSRYTQTPFPDFSEEATRFELFALHSVRQHFNRFISEDLDKGPFVLSHSDMHLRNILVDEKLHIHGIIDWEFVNVVPIQLAVPPLWGVNQEPGMTYFSIWFHRHLFLARDQERFARLGDEWAPNTAEESFILARLIRHPSDLSELFNSYFVEKQSIADVDLAEKRFFDQRPELADEARARASRNEDWTRYLKEHDLYGPDA